MNRTTAIFKKIIAAAALLTAFIPIAGCSSKLDHAPPSGSGEITITHYSFGKMVIDGKTYESDLAISTDKTVKNWRMGLVHQIQLEDVKHLVSDDTRMLIIGIGALNVCSVDQDVIDYLKSKAIVLHVLSTGEAVKRFNASPKPGLAAVFHLNC